MEFSTHHPRILSSICQRKMRQNIAQVKHDISSTFSRAAELVKSREAFILSQVEFKERTLLEHVERNQLQPSDMSCQCNGLEQDMSLMSFEADADALKQVISSFGKICTSSGVLEHTLSNCLEDFETASAVDENEDDFIVLAGGSEISSVRDEDMIDSSIESKWIDADHQKCNVAPLCWNPIAEVVEKVTLDNDETWISCERIMNESHGNDLTPDWDHVDIGDLTFSSLRLGSSELSGSTSTIADASVFTWLKTDIDMLEQKRPDPLTAGTSMEAAAVGLGLDQSNWFRQWLNDASIPSSPRSLLLTHSMSDMSTQPKCNPLAHVFSDSYNHRFQMLEKTMTTIGNSTSFQCCCEEDIGTNPPSDPPITSKDMGFFAKIVDKPTEYWLDANACKNVNRCLPLSYWLCPSAITSTTECNALSNWLCPTSMNSEMSDRLSVDPLNIFTVSNMNEVNQRCNPSMADGFTCFVQSVMSSSSSRWLLASSSSKLSALPASCPATSMLYTFPAACSFSMQTKPLFSSTCS